MNPRFICQTFALGSLITPLAVQANEPRLADFAEGQTLITEGNYPLYQLTLPEQVYRRVAHADLRDVRVFNADGQSVPHLIKVPEAQPHVEEQQIELPLFPLDTDATASSTNWHLKIEVDGSLVSYDNTRATTETRAPTSWIIDLSKLDKPLNALSFRFRADSDSFVQKVQISESENLHEWHVLTESTLASMTFVNRQLTQDRVTLSRRNNDNYLRITAIDPVSGFVIEQVSGTLRTEQQTPTKQHFVLNAASSPQPDRIDFDLGGSFRITGLTLQLPVPNSLFQVSLYSRQSPHIDWQFRQEGTTYRLVLNDEQITDNGFALNHNDRYWQAHFTTSAIVQGQTPTLRVTWQPDELFFVAQGSAPFTLAYGNSQLTSQQPAVHALLNHLDADQQSSLIGRAQVGQIQTFQGSRALEKKPEIPWTRWLLWSLLAMGVLVAGRMAWRLKGEMLDR